MRGIFVKSETEAGPPCCTPSIEGERKNEAASLHGPSGVQNAAQVDVA